jgi:hypothetical protein
MHKDDISVQDPLCRYVKVPCLDPAQAGREHRLVFYIGIDEDRTVVDRLRETKCREDCPHDELPDEYVSKHAADLTSDEVRRAEAVVREW